MVEKATKKNTAPRDPNPPTPKKRKKKEVTDPPITSTEARERDLINRAYNLAKQQIDEGTVSSGVLVHFLKLATEKEKTEREIMKAQAKLINAKTESLESSKNSERMHKEAIEAMTKYSGQ